MNPHPILYESEHWRLLLEKQLPVFSPFSFDRHLVLLRIDNSLWIPRLPFHIPLKPIYFQRLISFEWYWCFLRIWQYQFRGNDFYLPKFLPHYWIHLHRHISLMFSAYPYQNFQSGQFLSVYDVKFQRTVPDLCKAILQIECSFHPVPALKTPECLLLSLLYHSACRLSIYIDTASEVHFSQ